MIYRNSRDISYGVLLGESASTEFANFVLRGNGMFSTPENHSLIVCLNSIGYLIYNSYKYDN